MKQETNNEMDLLLRRLGQRQDVFAPDAEDHLDADELNAYSENVLPAKTRARYTEHLAECSRCRELVVQLSSSAGVVIAAQTDKISVPSGWRKFLASLFSPMVLRYAGPALGLVVVAVIGVVVLRREKSNDYVSQIQNQELRPVVTQPTAPNQPGIVAYDSAPKTIDSVNSVNKETVTANAAQPTPTPVPHATSADVAADTPETKAPVVKQESQPAAAEPPPPSPAKLDAATDEKRQKSEDAARNREEEVKVAPKEVATSNFELGKAKKGEGPAAMRAGAAKNKTEVSDSISGAGAVAPASPRRRGPARDDKDSNEETRSVAGREFRKQGGIWTDTAYDSSMRRMNLTRGSEAYRTVVADEPAIKTIADQLDGEIIVVWKNRTYHIH